MDDAKIAVRTPVAATESAVVFSMRNLPLLEQGTTYDPLATAENLWVSVKVYASGGENALHSHGGEDHSFIVLQGKANFTFADGRRRACGQGARQPVPRRHPEGCHEADQIQRRLHQGRRRPEEWRDLQEAGLRQGQILFP